MRFTGPLRPTKSDSRPGRIVFLDVETRPTPQPDGSTRQIFRLAVACYWRPATANCAERLEWRNFTEQAAVWDWLLGKATKGTTLTLTAHNAKFDLLALGMLRELPKRGWTVERLIESGFTLLLDLVLPNDEYRKYLEAGNDITQWQGSRWERRVKVVDNANLFPSTLDALGQALGIPKLRMPPYNAPDEEWFVYCRRDVEVMLVAWRKRFEFLERHGLGSFRPTLASQSLFSYRRRFMRHAIVLHDHEAATSLERAAYRGGRSEAFYVGPVPESPIYKLDINSMYPYVMREHSYPVQLCGHEITDDGYVLSHLIRRYAVIADVRVRTDEPVYPIRTRTRNVYPVGEFETTLTTPELKYAIRHRHLLDLREIAWYRTAPIFSEYVEFFYALKRAASERCDATERMFAKLMLNTLYGKFGQKGRSDRLVGRCPPEVLEVEYGFDAVTQTSVTYTYVAGNIIESVEEGESTYSFPAIAAHVTAYARMYLWSLFEKAGRQNVYYTDTDSLFVNQAGFDRLRDLVDPGELGALKVEAIVRELVIYAPKDYEADGKPTRKGVPKTAWVDEQGAWHFDQWPSLRSHVRTGERDTFVNQPTTRKLTRRIDWGVRGPDGWITPYDHNTLSL